MKEELLRQITALHPSEFCNQLEQSVTKENWSRYHDLLYYRCFSDIRLFAKVFFPHYCTRDFNLFHDDTFRVYQSGERGVRRAHAAPRGNAKSTIKALIKPIHDICYNLERFILIISNTEQQANEKAKDIQSELLINELLITIFGRMLPSRRNASTDFVTNNNGIQCRVLAAGAGTEIRGIKFGHSRPTKIILDDIEHSTEVESEYNRTKMLSWYNDVVSNIGTKESNIEVIGTILHERSLLKNLIDNPTYQSKIYRSIISWAENKNLWDKWKDIYINLDNSNRENDAMAFYLSNKEAMDKGVQVLWPDNEPYYDLQKKIIEIGMRSFLKEKQNSPMSDEQKIFNFDDFWWYEETPNGLRILKNNSIIPWDQLTAYAALDPSTGERKPTSTREPDFSSIVCGYKDAKNRLFVHSDFTRRVAPSIFIRKIYELNDLFKFYKFGVETNLYRNLLIKNILDEKARIEAEQKRIISLKFYEINLTENKHERIYTLEPKIFHGHILFNKNGLSQEFLNQMQDFPKAVHDDAPDALEMLWGLVNNKYRTGVISRQVGP